MPEVYNINYDEELLYHLVDADSWETLRAEGFRADLVQDESIRDIYLWAERHVRKYGTPPTPSVLTDEFPDIELEDPETTVGDLVDRMRWVYSRVQGYEKIQEIGKAYEKDTTQIHKLLSKAGRDLSVILERRGEEFGTGDFERAKRKYEEQAAKGKGPSFCFPEIDDYLHGQRGVSILVGPPKGLKSWLMISGILTNIENGIYPWLYSLELPAEESDMRLRCMMANIPYFKYVRGELTVYELRVMDEMSKALDEIGVYKIIKPPPGERDIVSMVQRAQDAGAGAVFIDQLQYVEADGRPLGGRNEPGDYWEVLSIARDMSDEIPIMFAHQFNRSILNAEEMPSYQQAKGSAAIEETATTVLGLWASTPMRYSKLCELSTLAVRNMDFRSWMLHVNLGTGCEIEVREVVEADKDDGEN